MFESNTKIPGPLGQKIKPVSRRLLSPWLLFIQSCLPRMFDLVSSLVLVLLLFPLLLLRGIIAYLQTGHVLKRQIQLGRFQNEFERLSSDF